MINCLPPPSKFLDLPLYLDICARAPEFVVTRYATVDGACLPVARAGFTSQSAPAYVTCDFKKRI